MEHRDHKLHIHNFYLAGKGNFGQEKSLNKISRENCPPSTFNFRETIQEVGLDIKLQHNNFKYNEESESIVVFDPFHFKDFDFPGLNLWSYYELLFHQNFLYGASFNTNKIEIYETFREHLVSIYGEYKNIPDQDNSRNTVAWFFDDLDVSIYLEIEQKGKGEKFLVISYYDNLLHLGIKNNQNLYHLINYDSHRRDESLVAKSTKKGVLAKLFHPNRYENKSIDFKSIQSHVDNLLLNDNTKTGLEEIANYLIAKINSNHLNLEIGSWLIHTTIKIQEKLLLKESEKLYNIIINWIKTDNFLLSSERIELIASACKNLINVYCDSNKHTEAINCFNECTYLLEKNAKYINNYNFSFISGQANYNVAIAFSHLRDFEKAIYHSKKALHFFEPFVSPWVDLTEISTIILSINNLGSYYSEIEEYDEAAKNYAMAMRFAFDNNRHYDSSVINLNLAINWVKQEKYNEAENQFKVLLNLINTEPAIYNGSPLKGQILVNLADLYKLTKDREREVEYLNSASSFYENSLSSHPDISELVKNLQERK